MFIFRGDTEAEASKTNNLRMKLDMRIMLMKNEKYLMEGSTCEYAKKATSYKLFKDRLKLVISGKTYINEIISTCPYLTKEDILEIKAPFLQITGFRAVLSVIHLKDHGLYVVEDLVKFYFPTTKSHLKTGHLQKLIMAFSLIKVNYLIMHT